MAEVIDAAFYRGDNVTLVFTATEPTAITGWTLEFTLKVEYGDATAVLSKTTTSGITITDASSGVFAVALTPADTLLEPGYYSCSVRRTNAGFVRTLAAGQVRVRPEASV